MQVQEKGEWLEKYLMKEQDKEWRFPPLTVGDFELPAESARAARIAVILNTLSCPDCAHFCVVPALCL